MIEEASVDQFAEPAALIDPEGRVVATNRFWAAYAIPDIAYKVKGQDALRLREARFEALLDSSNDAIVVLDENGLILWSNKATMGVFGYDDATLVGSPAVQLCHPDDLDRATSAVRVRVGERAQTEFRVRRADGTFVPVEVIVTNLLHEPAVGGIVVTARDVTDRVIAQTALRRSEERFRSLVQHSIDVTTVVDAEGKILHLSPSALTVLGRSPEELEEFGRTPGGQAWIQRLLACTSDEPGASGPVACELKDGRGRKRRLEGTWVNHLERPEVGGFVFHLRDVTDERETQQLAQNLLEVMNQTTDLVAVSGVNAEMIYLNQAARRFLGVDPGLEDLSQVDFITCFPPASIEKVFGEAADAIIGNGIWRGEIELNRLDGSAVLTSAVIIGRFDAEGEVVTTTTVLRDLTERRELEAKLAHQATHDPLTGLPNRVLLYDRLAHALARTERSGGKVGVLFIDVDNFKVVNDSLGHQSGDQMLKVVASRISAAVRRGDTVARFGGDEFVVVCEDVDDESVAIEVASRIQECLTAPVDTALLLVADGDLVPANQLQAAASIGIAFGAAEATAQSLIRDADAAMYDAKERGKHRFELFDTSMRERAISRLRLETDLRRALETDALYLEYQPVFDLRTNRVSAVEALLRWNDSERGRVAPNEFIPVAEACGLIVPLGAFVLERACTDLQRLCDGLGGGVDVEQLKVNVNISGRQLVRSELFEHVRHALAVSGLPAPQLTLEITETVLMGDVAMSQALLEKLRELGVGVAVDDFGTGYSSLAYLRRFPVDVLKIDRSFVDGISIEREDAEVVAAIIGLASALRLEVVAEGVESQEQLDELGRLGCDYAQGFLLARPMPLHKLRQFLQGQRDIFGPV